MCAWHCSRGRCHETLLSGGRCRAPRGVCERGAVGAGIVAVVVAFGGGRAGYNSIGHRDVCEACNRLSSLSLQRSLVWRSGLDASGST